MPDNSWAIRFRLERNKRQLTESVVKETAPERAGVYAIFLPDWATDVGCVYVGRSRTVRDRLLSHIRHSHSDCVREYVDLYTNELMFSAEAMASPGDAIALEADVIRELHPICNVLENR